jgi:hypothetical protein
LGLKKEEITGGWRELYNELRDLRYSPNFIRMIRSEDDIKRDLQKVGGGCGDWMERAPDRDRWRALVSTVMNFRVP